MAVTPTRVVDVCSPDTRSMINDRFDTTWVDGGLDTETLRRLLPGHDVVITSWGTPPLPADCLGDPHGQSTYDGSPTGPTVVGHAAGTIKNLIPQQALDRVTVFSAAPRIAWSVGEYCLTALLTLLRRLPQYDHRVRSGGWKPDDFRGRELRGLRIGIVGASSTAQAFIRLLQPFDVDVLAYDPYLDGDRAAQLGVRSVSLEEVVECPVLSIHVPATPATEGMITAELIDRIPDDGIVINSSRATAVDTSALLTAASTGRLRVAMDVFPSEPPSLPSEVLADRNLLLSPHIAGDTLEGHRALVATVVRDVIDYLDTGRRGTCWVDPAALAITA